MEALMKDFMNETTINMMMAVSYEAIEMVSSVIELYILLYFSRLSEAQYKSMEALMKDFMNETTMNMMMAVSYEAIEMISSVINLYNLLYFSGFQRPSINLWKL